MQNTSMDEEAIGRLRFNKLERLLEGFSKNNKEQQELSNGNPSSSKKTLYDKDALRFLIDNGGKL